jgi:laccase
MLDFNQTRTATATLVKKLRYNSTVEIVLQGPPGQMSYSNPMHLHGHDFFILAQGLGYYDPEKDVQKYNLVNPLVKNTAHVPMNGWTVIRFVTSNPGMCNYTFLIDICVKRSVF